VSRATPGDDAELRALLRRSVIPGSIRVAFTREPSLAAGEGLAGARDTTVVQRQDGAVHGMGKYGVRELNLDGGTTRVGYLGELRVDPEARHAPRVLRDGYAELARAAEAAGEACCFTSIATDNARARRVLEVGPRLGLPAYHPLGHLVTLVAPVSRPRTAATGGARRATTRDELPMSLFLGERARAHHFTLAWDSATWRALERHGVAPTDFHLVEREGRLTAAAAIWDQRAFRQTIIDGYGGLLQLTRPLVNLTLTARGLPTLPPPGSTLAQAAMLGASADTDAGWGALWTALSRQAWQQGIRWLTLARDANDPELPMLRRLLHAREYHTVLYEVAWPGRPRAAVQWASRPFRPEVALL